MCIINVIKIQFVCVNDRDTWHNTPIIKPMRSHDNTLFKPLSSYLLKKKTTSSSHAAPYTHTLTVYTYIWICDFQHCACRFSSYSSRRSAASGNTHPGHSVYCAVDGINIIKNKIKREERKQWKSEEEESCCFHSRIFFWGCIHFPVCVR